MWIGYRIHHVVRRRREPGRQRLEDRVRDRHRPPTLGQQALLARDLVVDEGQHARVLVREAGRHGLESLEVGDVVDEGHGWYWG